MSFAVGLAPNAGVVPAQAQDINIVMALPSPTLTFSSAFLAEDAGFYKKEGLKVSTVTIVGVGSANAVIAGSADFTIGTGPVFLRAAARGQRLFAIANLIDRPLVELVLRKDVADAAGITDATPFAERAKALKGKTIGIQGVGSIIHAWERLVAHRGGLDVEKGRPHCADGAARHAGGAGDQGDRRLLDLAAVHDPGGGEGPSHHARERPARCARPAAVRLWAGLHQARHLAPRTATNALASRARSPAPTGSFLDKPAEALAILKKRFDKMDQEVLVAAWKEWRRPTPRTSGFRCRASITRRRSVWRRSFGTKRRTEELLDGLFTDEFVR